MNSEDLAKQADRLYLDAALMLTRLNRKMRHAVRLVMLDGVPLTKAARRVGRPRQNVWRAVAKAKKTLEIVKAEIE